jgi:hypothetical protein
MRIVIETIPHSKQRYETVGDWQWTPKGLRITVSAMGDWKKEFLVAFHELAEVMLCKDRDILQSVVDQFDMAFEANRVAGNEDEPGDDPEAPYRKEHFFATTVERLMAAELGVDWKEYEDTVEAL